MEAVWCGGVGGFCRHSGVWWSYEIPSMCVMGFFFFMFDNYTFSRLIKQDLSTRGQYCDMFFFLHLYVFFSPKTKPHQSLFIQ